MGLAVRLVLISMCAGVWMLSSAGVSGANGAVRLGAGGGVDVDLSTQLLTFQSLERPEVEDTDPSWRVIFWLYTEQLLNSGHGYRWHGTLHVSRRNPHLGISCEFRV